MKAIASQALLLHRVEYGESDVIATFLTEAQGKVAAIVRGARKNPKRLGGALEPFHTLDVKVTEREGRGGDLVTLREASIVQLRPSLVRSLEALDAAGTALRWTRHACPPRTREPEAWHTLLAFLDALDVLAPCDARDSPRPSRAPTRALLAEAGLRLLADLGYGLDFERCIRCGKVCPPGRSAAIDPAGGGLVCSSCGGAHLVLDPRLRTTAQRMQGAPREEPAREADGTGGGGDPTPAEIEILLTVVDTAMAAHAGFERAG